MYCFDIFKCTKCVDADIEFKRIKSIKDGDITQLENRVRALIAENEELRIKLFGVFV